MKLINIIIYKSSIHFAIEKGNKDIIKLLLSRSDIDVNRKLILNHFFVINLVYIYILFLSNSTKIILFMTF